MGEPLTQSNVAEQDFLRDLDQAVRRYFGDYLNATGGSGDEAVNEAEMDEAVNDIVAYIYRRMGTELPGQPS